VCELAAQLFLKKLLKFRTVVPIDKAEREDLMKIAEKKLMPVTANGRALNRKTRGVSPNVSLHCRGSHQPTADLASVPDVRAEEVARGKALVADPNYPSKEQIRKIAGVLAANLDRNPAAKP
jgi:hypothetical protein